jgi:hypothetical protein
MRLVLLAAFTFAASAQEPPSEARAIYDAAKTPVFVLQRACPWIEHCRGAEISGWYAGDRLGRIVLHAWTDTGAHAVEYYVRGDAVLYVYENFEYFAETAPRGAARAGRGLPGWERRYIPATTPPAVHDLRAILERARRDSHR